MNNCGKKVLDQIIKVTVANSKFKEVDITENVSEGLKKKKQGLFQNEVDYRILFPDFTPPISETNNSTKYRADLVGFSDGGLSLIELKIYDEEKRNKNNWGVLYYLNKDRLKIEAAVKANKNNLNGIGAIVIAIKNTTFKKNNDQINLMIDMAGTLKKGERYPSIKNSNYFSILDALVGYTNKDSNISWAFENIRKGKTAFLVGWVKLEL